MKEELDYLTIRNWLLSDCYQYCCHNMQTFNKYGRGWAADAPHTKGWLIEERELYWAIEQSNYDLVRVRNDNEIEIETFEYWCSFLVLDAKRSDDLFKDYASRLAPIVKEERVRRLESFLPAQEVVELCYDLAALGFIEDKGYSDFVPTLHYVIEQGGEYPVMRKPLADEQLNLFTIRAWVLDFYYIYCRQKLKRMKDHGEKWRDGERELDYACAQFDESILKRPIERVMLYATYLILDANRGPDSFREMYRRKIDGILKTIDLNHELAQLDDNERLHFESDLKVLKLIETTR